MEERLGAGELGQTGDEPVRGPGSVMNQKTTGPRASFAGQNLGGSPQCVGDRSQPCGISLQTGNPETEPTRKVMGNGSGKDPSEFSRGGEMRWAQTIMQGPVPWMNRHVLASEIDETHLGMQQSLLARGAQQRSDGIQAG